MNSQEKEVQHSKFLILIFRSGISM